MDWTAPIDLYCERVAPGFWNEPLNAVTNAAFVVAAAALWHHRRAWMERGSAGPAPRVLRIGSALLCGLLAAIGLASFAFHTLASRWAGALDSLTILAFLLAYASVWSHGVAGLPARAWPLPPLVLGLAVVGAGAGARALGAPGVGLYGGAWSVLVGMAVWSLARGLPGARWLPAAAGVFVVSLTLRQLDIPLCESWPHGTHFGWHILNAVTLYLCGRGVMARRA
jgi:hypothetical protein